MSQPGFEALTAKVKAMYGRRLRYGDFQRMAALPDVSAVLDDLRQTPWAPAVERLDGTRPDRATLEAALRDQVREEYVRLSCFVPRGYRLLLSYPVYQAELEGILACLRRLKAGRARDGRPLPQRFLLHSKMDYRLLASCESYSGLSAAAERTIYASALRRMQPEQADALPNYLVAESTLRTVYYSSLMHMIRRHDPGGERDILLQALGTQADLQNIMHMLRMKRFFPGEKDPDLLPFRCRVSPALLNRLSAAPTEEAVLALLAETPYAGVFQGGDGLELEDCCRLAMYRLYRRQLTSGAPGVFTAIAYLHLKDEETRCLINLIESVNYGVPFDDSFAKVIGSS